MTKYSRNFVPRTLAMPYHAMFPVFTFSISKMTNTVVINVVVVVDVFVIIIDHNVDDGLLCLYCVVCVCVWFVIRMVYPRGNGKKHKNKFYGREKKIKMYMICSVAYVWFCFSSLSNVSGECARCCYCCCCAVVPLNSLLICVSPLICLIEWT